MNSCNWHLPRRVLGQQLYHCQNFWWKAATFHPSVNVYRENGRILFLPDKTITQ